MISFQDFEKIDIRVGTIMTASPNEKAHKPAFILEINFGDLGIRKSSAQITTQYSCDDLIGKQIVAVVNFPPKQVATVISECLVLGALGINGGVTLLTTDRECMNGWKIA